MAKIPVFLNKTLKLTNACIREILDDDLEDIDKVMVQMENYIRAKGARPVGPLVQYMNTVIDDSGELDIQIKFIQQVNMRIPNLEAPYTMKGSLKSKPCLFARFNGEQHHLKYAYDKLNLLAYEENIPLSGITYTVFTSHNNDEFSADVFMEKAE